MEIKGNLWNKITSTLLIKSIVWNSIVECMKKEKNQDITSYLTSVNVKWNVFLIKTQNPLINGEIQMIENILKWEIKKKLQMVGVPFNEFEIRYL